MNKIFKCLNFLLIALHSFYAWYIFLSEIYKIKDYEFFSEKENESFKKRKYVFTRIVIKIKIIHSGHDRVVRVTIMSQSSCSCFSRISLVLHLFCSCLTIVAFVSLLFHTCCTCVTCIVK